MDDVKDYTRFDADTFYHIRITEYGIVRREGWAPQLGFSFEVVKPIVKVDGEWTVTQAARMSGHAQCSLGFDEKDRAERSYKQLFAAFGHSGKVTGSEAFVGLECPAFCTHHTKNGKRNEYWWLGERSTGNGDQIAPVTAEDALALNVHFEAAGVIPDAPAAPPATREQTVPTLGGNTPPPANNGGVF
jgi:hypothetical protein